MADLIRDAFSEIKRFFDREHRRKMELVRRVVDLMDALGWHLVEGKMWDLIDELEKSNSLSLKSMKIPLNFGFDEDMFEMPCYGNAGHGHRHRKLSLISVKLRRETTLREEKRMRRIFRLAAFMLSRTNWQTFVLLSDFGECPGNYLLAPTGSNQVKQVNTKEKRFPLDNNESRVNIEVELFRQLLDWDGKMSSQLKGYYITGCNLNKHKETMPRRPMFHLKDTFKQHKRKETMQHVSSVVVLAIISLYIFWDICIQSSSLMKLQPLPKEHVSVSIWPSLVGLLGFMLFVWAVATMILVGAPFTRLHRAMLIFWAIWMNVKSA